MGPSINSTELGLLPAIHGQLRGSAFDLPQAVVPAHLVFSLSKDQEIAALQNEVAKLKKDREIHFARHKTLL